LSFVFALQEQVRECEFRPEEDQKRGLSERRLQHSIVVLLLKGGMCVGSRRDCDADTTLHYTTQESTV